MRKKLLILLLIFLLVATVASGIVACGVSELEAPVVYVSKAGLAIWNYVTDAKSYEVRVNNVVYPCDNTYFDLLSIDNLPEDRQFVVRVRAVNGKVYSDWSNMAVYEHAPTQLDAPEVNVANGKITWIANPNAVKVVVTINGVSTELPATATEYDLSAVTQNCVIGVQFIGNGITSTDSLVVKINYNVLTGVAALSAPANVRMDGFVLTFDAVGGADTYYLVDIYGKVTTISTNTSDRAHNTLVKELWAADSTGRLADSEVVQVPLFTEGNGTQTNPFIINSPAELRFIEYYEIQNEAKYYKFGRDVVLDAYTPASDEVYNNFYNLGSLSGVIDGNGHKLVNQVVYFSDGYSSLFDSIAAGGVIKNLVIDNANFRTWTEVSGDGIMQHKGGECAILAFTNRGTIDNVTVINSSVYAEADGAAALVSINRGTIRNCIVDSTTTVHGANEAGSIAAFNVGAIAGCINRGTVSGGISTGGIVGRNSGAVSQCGNEGAVNGSIYGGGIVGYNYNIRNVNGAMEFNSIISQCYNSGKVTVASYGGGIAGKNGSDGNETGQSSFANAGIISCYNVGEVSGVKSIGGVVGINYGYHNSTSDLGVINCYNAGALTLNSEARNSTRVFLSVDKYPGATSNNAVFYVYYWSDAISVSWPGTRLTPVTISGKTYYYADLDMGAQYLTGLIFSRCNASGVVLSQSKDITARTTAGNTLYTIDSNWKDASVSSSQSLVAGTPAPTVTAGGIAGYNNMVNDCYFLSTKVNNVSVTAGLAQGTTLTNKTLLNGATATSSACEISSSELSTFASTLNNYANVWEDSANGPVLKWQRR